MLKSIILTLKLIVICFILSLFINSNNSIAATVDKTEIRELIKLPVENIIAGTPIYKISDEKQLQKVQKNFNPVVIMFYINQEDNSQRLATLIRYLANEFHDSIMFCAFKISEEKPVDEDSRDSLFRRFGIEKAPATFVYNKTQAENNPEPRLKEYRVPGLFLWNQYYTATVKYLRKFLNKST